MKRREFLTAGAAATGLATTGILTDATAQSASSGGDAQYFEWRVYRLEESDQRQRVSQYLQRAALPAWKRAGVGPVGVWTEIGDDASQSIHVMLTFATIDQFAQERSALEADAGYQSAAADYMATAKDDPAFSRIDSSLMVAFDGMPKAAVPTDNPTAYELRIYESHSEAKARRKIEMFNNGEIPIFVDAGFQPVFFGETLIGSQLPHLQYMLASQDVEAHGEAWGKFGSHPDWVAMKDLPQYADTVSHITSIMLTPTDYSEI